MDNKNLKISIIDLFNRFKIFSYSTFQRYLKTKCSEDFCKREFVLYLNDIYNLEYKSRKKIMDFFSNEELIELSNLISLSEIEQHKFNIIKLLIEKLDKKNSLLFGRFFYENYKFLINEFDNFIISKILKNIKLCQNQKIKIMPINKFDSSLLTKDNDRILLITEFNKFLKIKEAIKVNSNITFKELKEPRWVVKERDYNVDYIDYCFNLLTIEFKENKPFQIKFNGNIIINELQLKIYERLLNSKK